MNIRVKFIRKFTHIMQQPRKISSITEPNRSQVICCKFCRIFAMFCASLNLIFSTYVCCIRHTIITTHAILPGPFLQPPYFVLFITFHRTQIGRVVSSKLSYPLFLLDPSLANCSYISTLIPGLVFSNSFPCFFKAFAGSKIHRVSFLRLFFSSLKLLFSPLFSSGSCCIMLLYESGAK